MVLCLIVLVVVMTQVQAWEDMPVCFDNVTCCELGENLSGQFMFDHEEIVFAGWRWDCTCTDQDDDRNTVPEYWRCLYTEDVLPVESAEEEGNGFPEFCDVGVSCCENGEVRIGVLDGDIIETSVTNFGDPYNCTCHFSIDTNATQWMCVFDTLSTEPDEEIEYEPFCEPGLIDCCMLNDSQNGKRYDDEENTILWECQCDVYSNSSTYWRCSFDLIINTQYDIHSQSEEVVFQLCCFAYDDLTKNFSSAIFQCRRVLECKNSDDRFEPTGDHLVFCQEDLCKSFPNNASQVKYLTSNHTIFDFITNATIEISGTVEKLHAVKLLFLISEWSVKYEANLMITIEWQGSVIKVQFLSENDDLEQFETEISDVMDGHLKNMDLDVLSILTDSYYIGFDKGIDSTTSHEESSFSLKLFPVFGVVLVQLLVL